MNAMGAEVVHVIMTEDVACLAQAGSHVAFHGLVALGPLSK